MGRVFQSLKFVIVPFGKDMGAARCQVLETRIKQSGGTVTTHKVIRAKGGTELLSNQRTEERHICTCHSPSKGVSSASQESKSLLTEATHVVLSDSFVPSLDMLAKSLKCHSADVLRWISVLSKDSYLAPFREADDCTQSKLFLPEKVHQAIQVEETVTYENLKRCTTGCSRVFPVPVSVQWIAECLRRSRLIELTASSPFNKAKALTCLLSTNIKEQTAPCGSQANPLEVDAVLISGSGGSDDKTQLVGDTTDTTGGISAPPTCQINRLKKNGRSEENIETRFNLHPVVISDAEDSDDPNCSDALAPAKIASTSAEDCCYPASPTATPMHSKSNILGGKKLTKSQKNLLRRRTTFACQLPVNSLSPFDSSKRHRNLEYVSREPSGQSDSETINIGDDDTFIPDTFPEQALEGQTEAYGLSTTEDATNAKLVQLLKELEESYKGQKNEFWRERTYRQAASVVSKLPYHIGRLEDLDRPELKLLGAKTKQKIAEYIRTGLVSKLDSLKHCDRNKVLSLFCRIWGVGRATAERFYSLGFRDFNDLRNNPHILNSRQQIGLDLFDELETKMSREEAKIIFDKINEAAEFLFPQCLELTLCGSYRRGRELVGDVDVLITPKDSSNPTTEVESIVNELKKRQLMKHELTSSEGVSMHMSRTFMGICQLSPQSLHRRIDIKIYPKSEKPFALLAFTGSGHFNRSMRLFARKMGYSLSDHELIPVTRLREGKISMGKPMECISEEAIFEVLGLEYRTPCERDL